jgi:hypothetical protein
MTPEWQFFLLAAIPAVVLIGLSKGGFASGIGMLGTPLVALVASPVEAAAILLPVLLAMDAVGLWTWRSLCTWRVVRQMLPGALLGTLFGWATAAMVSDAVIRILLGVISITFAFNQMAAGWLKRRPARESAVKANLWGALAGYTSFVAHAGAPPFQAYVLPLGVDRLAFAGTSAVFFAIVNVAKVPPYFALGQFTADNLLRSFVLAPFAIAGTLAGVWLVHRVSDRFFFGLTYAAMLVVGAKLIIDGAAAL